VNQKTIMIFLAGYLLAFLLPPQRLLGFFKRPTN
jgi:hypothetical protein